VPSRDIGPITRDDGTLVVVGDAVCYTMALP